MLLTDRGKIAAGNPQVTMDKLSTTCSTTIFIANIWHNMFPGFSFHTVDVGTAFPRGKTRDGRGKNWYRMNCGLVTSMQIRACSQKLRKQIMRRSIKAD